MVGAMLVSGLTDVPFSERENGRLALETLAVGGRGVSPWAVAPVSAGVGENLLTVTEQPVGRA